MLQIRKHARCGREALGIGADASYALLRMSQEDTLGPRPTPSWRPHDGRAPPVRPGVGAIEGICSPQLNPRRYETWHFHAYVWGMSLSAPATRCGGASGQGFACATQGLAAVTGSGMGISVAFDPVLHLDR